MRKQQTKDEIVRNMYLEEWQRDYLDGENITIDDIEKINRYYYK